jgi:dihydrofolate reductase
MAMSVNGMIATPDDETPWSTEEWERFREFVARHKNIIIGRRTYDIMRATDHFSKLGDPDVVVITQQDIPHDHKTYFAHSPHEALAHLQKLGHTHCVVAGGSTINGLFIGEHLVDEIILDVEPILLSKGVPLYALLNQQETNLALMAAEQYGTNSVQLRYDVVK